MKRVLGMAPFDDHVSLRVMEAKALWEVWDLYKR